VSSPWELAILSLGYLGVLFIIAWHGDRDTSSFGGARSSDWVYPLSIGVYATSWTYYGAVGSAAASGWAFAPIYLGPMMVFIFCWPVILKFAAVVRTHHIGSLADFMSARYGRSHTLAVLTTLIALFGTIPYIALQLKAVGQTFNIMSGAPATIAPEPVDAALFAALLLTLFAILFGTRLPGQRRDHHRGMMIAIAVESLVKLAAFLLVGLFCVFELFDGFKDLFDQARAAPQVANVFHTDFSQAGLITQFVLASLAIICLPRQFHVTFVEAPEARSQTIARWVFPLYLLGFTLFVIPIAAAGLLKFGTLAPADAFVLLLPMAFNNDPLAALAFLGGLSAAAAMILVSTLALAIMLANEIVLPLIFRASPEQFRDRPDLAWILVSIRRACIVAVMALAWLYYQSATSERTLAAIGLVAFAAAAQFAPALLGGLYWRNGNRNGALASLTVGLFVWLFTLVIPELDSGVTWVSASADALGIDDLTLGVLLSLGLNLLSYIAISMATTARLIDRIQAAAFVDAQFRPRGGPSRYLKQQITVSDLIALAGRYLGMERVQGLVETYKLERSIPTLSPKHQAPAELLDAIESTLAQEIGHSSARLVIRSASQRQRIHVGELVSLVDEASQLAQSNQDLLRRSIEHLSQGISVVDQNQLLVAWNRRYHEIFNFPDELLTIGRPIGDLYRHNVKSGLIGHYTNDEQIETAVQRRLDFLNRGTPYRREVTLSTGMTLEIIGQPTPNGGFVTSFSDVTNYKHTEQALRESEQAIRVYTDNLPAMIAYLDRDLRIQFINKAFERTMRVWREQVIGKPNREIFSDAEFKVREPYLKRALEGRRQRFEVAVDRVGERHEYEALYVPHRDESGTVQGIFVLYQDVTERNLAKRALEEANETLEARVTERTLALQEVNSQLADENLRRAATEVALSDAKRIAEQANVSKTRFLAAASHDLLQPLNAARLFCTSLSERAETAEIRELTHHLEGALGSAESLISTLLEISKLDAGALKKEEILFDLRELVGQLSEEFRIIADDRQIGFTTRMRSAVVQTDPKLLRRVLQNLISNALRYTDRGGRVLVAMRMRDTQVLIEIWDTGIGIHPDDLPVIFDEFKRLSEGIQTDQKGLGLGLSISKRIIDLLRLQLTVRSIPGRGSLFRIAIPRALGTPIPLRGPHTRANAGLSKPLQDRQILVIDNDSSILQGMQALLGGWGASVHVAATLADALAVQTTLGRLDAALVDYHLDHGEYGTRIIAALREQQPELLAILITADRDDEMKQRAQRVGATVLHKPLKPAALRSLLTLKLRVKPPQPAA
jgi:PAS domain S-box-containing protein